MNKSFKKSFSHIIPLTLALVLTLTSAFSFAACGKENTESTDNVTQANELNPTGEQITLRILENDTAKKEGYFEKLLAAFNEKYAEYNIVAVDADMDEYTDLAQNGPYGYGPDVLYQANDVLMRYAADKHILPVSVSDFECGSQIPSEAWDAFKISFDGVTYTCGIPVNIQEPMLYYRKDMLPDNWQTSWDKDKNNTPDFLENWCDLYAYSKLLRDTDESPNKDSRYGLMLSYNDLYMNGEFIFSYGGYVFAKNADGTFDTKDIGFGAGNAAKGLFAMKQFAYLMNEGCIDDTITSNRYEKLANGTYSFAVSTPDTYVLFMDKLALQYEAQGLSEAEAKAKASENLVMTELPAKMPANGDLSSDTSKLSESDYVSTVVMGGVNGYGISAYTEHKAAATAFVDFATSYDMIKLRMDTLGIAPTRSDVAKESGGTTEKIFTSLAEGHIYLMPSVKQLNQVWTPAHTFLSDIAKDAFRTSGETEKYPDVNSVQEALDKVSQQVYDAIYTLAK